MARSTSQPTSVPSDNPFAALREELLQASAVSIPDAKDGWQTVEEVAVQLKIGVSRARHVLQEWLKLGRVERWQGVAPAYDGGRLVRISRYRVKKS